MKTLDAKALHTGIAGLKKNIQSQMEQVKQLESAVGDFSSMRNAFQGQGGTAIRHFYDDWHATILSYYQHMLKEFERVLGDVDKACTDFESDEAGFIRQSFLEAEVTQGVNKAKNFTTELVDDVNAALDNVSDIIYVSRLDDTRFHATVQRATRKITETIEDLGTFDSTQTNALNSVEDDLQLFKKSIDEIKSMFTSGKLTVSNFQPLSLKNATEFSHLKKDLATKRVMALGDALTSPFDFINGKLSVGDTMIAGYQAAVSFRTLKAAGKLKINYLGQKPTLWQKVKGNYRFSVGMDPSWTSKSKHSNKQAKWLLNFSRAPQPANPLMKPLHSFVKSYQSPSHLYKHVVGFPKNANVLTGKEFMKMNQERMSAGVKEVMGKTVTKSGLVNVGKRIPLIGTGVSIIANGGEFFSKENENKSNAEKTGRMLGGVAADIGSIAIGAKIGATIGSVGGPVGILVGGAVGAFAGGLASSKVGKVAKDIGGKIGKGINDFTKNVGNKLKKSIVSWFN
ncbi:LXG domain-containing protein [Metabacillus malikii]|uniref:LXG domain-containing protein n=1 Tax=Metabacillus malikii TaxID=1504265 RepID=A0ABT9ZFU1_9BACI|nr:LXG domain-containing protein [Metabacillus malikii]MDQ0230661.1 hypothetical protein [Metabacillus malikii]